MNIIIPVLICVVIALLAFEAGFRYGKSNSRTMQTSSTVSNTNDNKSDNGLYREYKLIKEYALLPHATSPLTRQAQFDAAKLNLAQMLGSKCLHEGFVYFYYKDNDYQQTSGVTYDRIWASISVRKM